MKGHWVDPVRLAELMCAHLCHDLSSPIGATAAGAELLADLGGADPDTVALVAASAESAAARLKFFRAALGPPAVMEQTVSTVRGLIKGYLETLKAATTTEIALEWNDAPGIAALDGGTARLLLNLALQAKDTLPYGGRLVVRVAGEETASVAAQGAIKPPPPEVVEILRGLQEENALPTTPKEAHAWFVRAAAFRLNRMLSLSIQSEALLFTLSPA